MNVKALKNLIYDGIFYKPGAVFDMAEKFVVAYESRALVIRLLTDGQKPVQKPAELPPLDDVVRKKK